MNKALINLAIISSIVSVIIVSTIDISWKVYGAVFFTQLILVIVNFSFSKNKNLFKNLWIINLIFFISYNIRIFILNNSVPRNGWEGLCFLIILCCIIATAIFLVFDAFNNKKDIVKSPKILAKRESDLNQLEYYINSFQIVGLNGDWGTGKTFLVNQLKKRLSKSYEFIEIDLLTCNLNEMQLTLINSFEELLYSRRILPKYANKLKRDISSASFLSKIQSLVNLAFTSSDSKAETLKGFMEETQRLDKKVLIIYEDIDRIENKEVIREIFAISEKIASENIRIIYQYSEELLIKQGFEHNYLEKYIPFKMNLTYLHFIEIIDFELKDKYRDILSVDDFKYLQLQDHRFNVLSDFFNYRGEYVLNIEYISIRKVQNMLAEIYSTLLKKDELQRAYKELVINFYIIKHLLPKQYEKLNIKQTLFETMQFNYEDKSYTILDLIHLEPNETTLSLLDGIFDNEENRSTYGILKLFNFKLFSPQKIMNDDRFNELKRLEKYKHEKMDRIIWKLLYEGKSVFTDYENAVKKMCEEVLDKEKNEQMEAFRQYQHNFFNNNSIITDNRTIFRMGMHQFENIYEAFKIAEVDEEYRMKLNDFYFEYRNSNEIDLSLIKCLNNSLLKSDKEYLQLISYFRQLRVTSNFNKSKDFFYFVNRFIDGLSEAKLIVSYEYYRKMNFNKSLDYEKQLAFIEECLVQLIKEVQRTKMIYINIDLLEFVSTFKEIEKFIEKILEIIKNPMDFLEETGPFINTEITSRYINQEEYDRLKSLISSGIGLKEVKEKIIESYNENRISLYEVTRLLEENEEFFSVTKM